MLKSFTACVALVDVDAHEPADEILGRVANIVPVRGIELEFTCHGKSRRNKRAAPSCTQRLYARNEGSYFTPSVQRRLFSRSIKSKSTARKRKYWKGGLLRAREGAQGKRTMTTMGKKGRKTPSCNRYTQRLDHLSPMLGSILSIPLSIQLTNCILLFNGRGQKEKKQSGTVKSGRRVRLECDEISLPLAEHAGHGN